MKHARIGAFQQDLLSRLEMRRPPSLRKLHNSTDAISEQRKLLQLYRKNFQELSGHHHNLYDDNEYLAKEFHSFTQKGMYPHLHLWAA